MISKEDYICKYKAPAVIRKRMSFLLDVLEALSGEVNSSRWQKAYTELRELRAFQDELLKGW